MPRLPDDSPILYPENTGEYMPEEFTRERDTCSTCVGNDDETVKDVTYRYSVGKYGAAEMCNTVCDSCLEDELAQTLATLKLRLPKEEIDGVRNKYGQALAWVISDLQQEVTANFKRRWEERK